MAALSAGRLHVTLLLAAIIAGSSCETTAARDEPTPENPAPTVRNGVIAYTEFFGGIKFVEAPTTVTAANLVAGDADDVDVSFLDWSPDGSELVYVEGEAFLGDTSIVVLDVGTGETRRLTEGFVDSSPVWSPDGRRIAFLRFERRSADLWVMNPDGSDAREINATSDRRWTVVEGSTIQIPPGPEMLDPETIVGSIAWAPDSERVAFGVDPHGERPEVRIVSADGEADPITHEGSYPSWSPEGDRLCIVRGTGLGSDLVLVSPEGGDQEELIGGSGIHTTPAWSPDGSRILFVSDEGGPPGKLELWVINNDGSDVRQLSRNATELEGRLPPGSLFPSWSPDGSSIAFLDEVFGGGAVDLWVGVVDADGGDVEILTSSESRWPAWQPLPAA